MTQGTYGGGAVGYPWDGCLAMPAQQSCWVLLIAVGNRRKSAAWTMEPSAGLDERYQSFRSRQRSDLMPGRSNRSATTPGIVMSRRWNAVQRTEFRLQYFEAMTGFRSIRHHRLRPSEICARTARNAIRCSMRATSEPRRECR
jgi:hypothetical protein